MSLDGRVVVIGGGVIGCAAALALARKGARVTLLERDAIAAGASSGGRAGSGHFSGQRFGQEAAAVGAGDRLDKRLRVGMHGGRPQAPRRRGLDHQPEVHDRDRVGDVADDREVVRDEQETDAQVAGEALQEVRHLCLRGRVERRERLVEDDHGRFGGERARDRDALALTSAVLVRESLGRRGGQADLLQQLLHAGAAAPGGHQAEDGHRVAYLVAHAAPGVERAERVLKHHLQPGVEAGTRALAHETVDEERRFDTPTWTHLRVDGSGRRSHRRDVEAEPVGGAKDRFEGGAQDIGVNTYAPSGTARAGDDLDIGSR